MPGPVSDSFDPEFSTAANAADVREAIERVVSQISAFPLRGKKPLFILDVIHARKSGPIYRESFTERDWRIIRFAMNRALETL